MSRILKTTSLLAAVVGFSSLVARSESLSIDTQAVAKAFEGIQAVLVVIDPQGEQVFVSDSRLAHEPFGPCSTFKIWNTLIGLEEGLLKNPDDPFWKWDGVERSFPNWNRDLSLREAFQASCVPAFQELARKIGPERMQAWLEKLDYGNKDLCGRPDSFWLPRAGQSNILITPEQQAKLLHKLVTGQLPVKPETINTLIDILRLESTPRSTLLGKTGSGLRASKDGPSADTDFDMGWLVGAVVIDGRPYSYACLVLGPGLGGKNAREKIQDIFRASGWL
jgi:beta-lactamase class D